MLVTRLKSGLPLDLGGIQALPGHRGSSSMSSKFDCRDMHVVIDCMLPHRADSTAAPPRLDGRGVHGHDRDYGLEGHR